MAASTTRFDSQSSSTQPPKPRQPCAISSPSDAFQLLREVEKGETRWIPPIGSKLEEQLQRDGRRRGQARGRRMKKMSWWWITSWCRCTSIRCFRMIPIRMFLRSRCRYRRSSMKVLRTIRKLCLHRWLGMKIFRARILICFQPFRTLSKHFGTRRWHRSRSLMMFMRLVLFVMLFYSTTRKTLWLLIRWQLHRIKRQEWYLRFCPTK